MTVIENLTPRKQYTYITGKQNYDITFPYIEKSYVKCMINDTLLTYPTQYEVPAFDETSLSTNQLQVVLKVTPTAGDMITIYRDTPIDQQTEFPQEARFSSQKITEALDKLTQLNQEQADDISQCLRLAKNLPEGFNTMLPFPEANQVIQWNEDGTQLINYDLRGEIAEFEEEVEDAIDEFKDDVNEAIDDFKSDVAEDISDIKTDVGTANTTAQTAETKANNAIETANSASSTAGAASTTAGQAKTIAESANTTAGQAKTIAQDAKSIANTASSNINTAVGIANNAKSTAENAASTASTASTDASTALTKANTAISTANDASTAASNAVSTANTASTNASTALSTANTASTNASNAVSTANTASTNASTALNTANTASTNATDAKNKVNTLETNIETVIEAAGKINELEEAVSTATQAATNASNAADTATAKAQEATQAAATFKQSDWNETDTDDKAYIKNKPTIPTVPTALSSFTDDLGSNPTHTHSQYLTAHQNLKTINGNSIVGTGDLSVDGLPSQTSHSGDVLTTDGSDASWSDLSSLGAVQTSDLTNVICKLNEITSGGFKLVTYSDGTKELICDDYTQSTAGAYTISYPSNTFTSAPFLQVDYHLAATASTGTTTRNYGYDRTKNGFTVYLAANAHISFYARGK